LIHLWRNKPVSAPNGIGSKFPQKNIFPSGRQAITFCLRHAGLGRKDLVAIPAWSSHCVISSVGKIVTPIPIQEVVSHNLDVEAVLIYDQWGWPVFDNSFEDLKERFKGKILIHDQVDSTNIPWSSDDSMIDEKYNSFESVYQVFSLSKTLGLSGGGMACWNGKWLESSIDNDHWQLMVSLNDAQNIHEINNNLLSNFMKFDIVALPAKVNQWLKNNDVSKAYQQEMERRGQNISVIVNAGLAKNWPVWIMKAVKDNNVPGIAPLLKGVSVENLNSVQKKLFSNFKLETKIYHFDWNGNQFMPDYVKCLALPVHGMVNNMNAIVKTLLEIKI